MSAARTRWGILGPGVISRDFAAGLRASAHGVLHAVGSSSPARAAAFAAEHGAEVAGSYDDILAREDVDAIYVGTVHTTHADLAVRALEAGKAVLCEKPAAPTLAEVERMLETAARVRRPFLEGFKTRFGPFADILGRLSAELGSTEPRRLEVSRGFPAQSRDGRLFDPALAGGAILDIGCYPVALAVQLAAAAGDPIDAPRFLAIEAELVNGVDGTAAAEFTLGGLNTAVESSIVKALGRSATLRVGDTEIIVPDVWGTRSESPRTIVVRRGGDEEILTTPVVHPMASEADALSAALAEGRLEVPEMPWAHTRAIARVLTDWRAGALAR